MGLTVLPLLVSAVLVLCSVDGFHRYRHRQSSEGVIELVPWKRSPRHTESAISFSFNKGGFLGRVSFEVDVLLPQDLAGRKISNIDVKFEPEVDAEVTMTRGGLGRDYATIHFESEERSADMKAYITLETE